MKRFLGLGLCFVSCALAACGGSSGGGPIPNPGPSATIAPVSYAVSIKYVSPMSGLTAQIQPYLHSDAAGTNAPVMLVSATDSHGCYGYNCVGTSQQGIVQVSVSPIPTSNPAVSYSNTEPHASVAPTVAPASPAPTPTGVISETGVATDGATNIQASGQISASVGTPVNTIATANVYQYVGIGVDCIPHTIFGNPSGGSWPGWKYDSGTNAWVQTSDPSTADIYCTGSNLSIPAAYQVAGDPGTLNFPGGCTNVSTDTAFYSLTTSQIVNPVTALTFTALQTKNGDGSMNAELICTTRDGAHHFKTFPNGVGSGGSYGNYDGAVEVSGAGVDGF